MPVTSPSQVAKEFRDGVYRTGPALVAKAINEPCRTHAKIADGVVRLSSGWPENVTDLCNSLKSCIMSFNGDGVTHLIVSLDNKRTTRRGNFVMKTARTSLSPMEMWKVERGVTPSPIDGQ